MNIISNDELAHHGIKGQRWGVRRFQNADGSLTSAGEKRYGDGDSGSSGSSNGSKSSNQQNLSEKDRKKAEKEKKKAIKKFENNVANNWSDSYNKATEVMNEELKKINKNPKYADEKLDDPGVYESYLNEVGKTWDKIYSNQLRKDFGEYPDDDSEDWVEYVPMYGMYFAE